MADDDLQDFEHTTFTHDGKTRAVYRTGTGPAVIVIAEIPGITPKVLEFGRRGAARGSGIHARLLILLPHDDSGRQAGKARDARFVLCDDGPTWP